MLTLTKALLAGLMAVAIAACGPQSPTSPPAPGVDEPAADGLPVEPIDGETPINGDEEGDVSEP
jgi:hypothetical protein